MITVIRGKPDFMRHNIIPDGFLGDGSGMFVQNRMFNLEK